MDSTVDNPSLADARGIGDTGVLRMVSSAPDLPIGRNTRNRNDFLEGLLFLRHRR